MDILIASSQPFSTYTVHFQGELTITSEMEKLQESLVLDVVPSTWAVKAYPSQLGLTSWYGDLEMRIGELDSWTSTFRVKKK